MQKNTVEDNATEITKQKPGDKATIQKAHKNKDRYI